MNSRHVQRFRRNRVETDGDGHGVIRIGRPWAIGALVAATCALMWTSLLTAGCKRQSGSAQTALAVATPAGEQAAEEHDHEEHAGDDDAHDHGADEHGHEHGADGHADEHGGDEHAAEVKLTAEAIARYGIRVDRASAQILRPTFVAPARVAFNSEAMAHVGSPLVGRVAELPARLGDVVQKGDVLLVVESPELGETQSNYLQRRIQVEAAIPAVDLAKSALDRTTRLYESGGIALDVQQRLEAEYRAAWGVQRSAESALLGAENKLHLLGMDQQAVEQLTESGEVQPRYAIRAPIPGRVVQREVTLGELVSPEKEALLVLADTTTLWVLADVPDARLPEVTIDAPAWLKSGAVNGHRHEGTVSYISPMVDPRTRSAQVRVAVQCEHGTLWPGMFVQVEITATDQANPDRSPVVAVPEDALQTVEGVPSIFVPVPNEANTFARRTVSLGKPVAGLVPIHSGLVEGDWYVAAGTFILKAELGKASAEHQH